MKIIKEGVKTISYIFIYMESENMKYKNKDGISLNYTNDNDTHQQLVKEVITEAIKIFEGYNRFDGRSIEYALNRGVWFLKDNFDLESK